MTDHVDYARQRRRTLGLLFASAAGALASGLPQAHAAESSQPLRELRIGYQKYGTFTLLKGRGTLDKRLQDKNIAVKWTEFPAGPQLLEGLNVGSIDVGTVGEAPPIFAQAAGANLVYFGNEPPSPNSEAIVVPKTSTVRTLADLKGKKIALNKGSNVHFLLVKALEKANIDYRAIQPVYLPPADARAAFERGAVDAWVIWDPFLAAAEKQLGARVLVTGQGLVANHQFYLAARPFAEQHPDVVRIVLEELAKVDEWGRTHPQEVSAILSAQTSLPPEVVALAAGRYTYGVRPVTAEVLGAQQKIADAFHNLKLIPKPLVVRDAAPPSQLQTQLQTLLQSQSLAKE
jgi:sulfonate transport system substrate-binding protein